jgi:predicted PurR-regulated permease PerM
MIVISLLSAVVISIIGFYVVRQISVLNVTQNSYAHKLEAKIEQILAKNQQVVESGNNITKQNAEILTKLEEVITELKASL